MNIVKNSVTQPERVLSEAGSALAALRSGYRANRQRRKIRKWTGYLGHRERAWRGRKVILPDGRVAEIYAAIRGLVGLAPQQRTKFRAADLLVRADQVHVWKHPAAVLLGRAKAGIVERKSVRKARAARLNASLPPRPGSQPRGRPRSTKG